MKITKVESFRVEVPLTDQQQGMTGYYNSTGITRIRTDGGITGYGFTECDAEEVAGILVGGIPSPWSGISRRDWLRDAAFGVEPGDTVTRRRPIRFSKPE